jgi:hypothetical protein
MASSISIPVNNYSKAGTKEVAKLQKETATLVKSLLEETEQRWKAEYGEETTYLSAQSAAFVSFVTHCSRYGAMLRSKDIIDLCYETLKVSKNNGGPKNAVDYLVNRYLPNLKRCSKYLGDNPTLPEIQARAEDPVLLVLHDMLIRGKSLSNQKC